MSQVVKAHVRQSSCGDCCDKAVIDHRAAFFDDRFVRFALADQLPQIGRQAQPSRAGESLGLLAYFLMIADMQHRSPDRQNVAADVAVAQAAHLAHAQR